MEFVKKEKKSHLSDRVHRDAADSLCLRIFSLRRKDSITGHGVYILSASFETSSPLLGIQIDKDESGSYYVPVRGLHSRGTQSHLSL